MTAQRLTWAQHIVWVGQSADFSSPHYNTAFCCDLKGQLDQAALTSAFEALSADIDILRLVFHSHDTTPTQEAAGRAPVLERISLDSRQAAQDWMEREALHVFDLTQCATRAALIQITPAHHVVFILQHHLVSDGRSAGLLFQALAARYNAVPSAAETQKSSYLGQAAPLVDAQPTCAFDGSADRAPMPLYGRDPGLGAGAKACLPLDIGPARHAALQALVATPGFRSLTPLMTTQNILAAMVAAWLARVTGESQVAFAMPQHNRVTPAVRDVPGLFMEMLPLEITVAPQDSFRSLFERMADATRVLLVQGGPGKTRTDLLRNRNVVLNVFSGADVQFNGLDAEVAIVPVLCSDPSHDINIEFGDLAQTGRFKARMSFDVSRFDAPSRTRAVDHFLAIFDAFLADADTPIAQLDILSAGEHAALADFNAKASAPQPSGTVLDRFHAGLSDASAVRMASAQDGLSHRELDRASNRLARQLQAKGVVSGDRVALHLPRSVDTVVAILACVKLGAAFVPLEVSASADRRAFILKDTAARLVISQDLPDAIRPDSANAQVADPLDIAVTADQPAYIIYTSGSTGTPKGVVVPHGALLGYCQMCLENYPLEQGKSFAFFSAFGFDLTINSLFMPLISQGQIVVYPEPEVGSDLAILDVFADDAVDIVKPTPSHLRLAIEGAHAPVQRIKCLPHSGEAFPAPLARRAYDVLGDVQIINEYGPTEAVVGAMLYHVRRDVDPRGYVSIGTPAPGMRIFVVNSALAHQPIGVVGEIAIGGRLAQGYLNRPDLTDQRFVDDPHTPGQRLYLTGDLGVFEASGALRFLGRMDDQVKLKGIRLELGAVEGRLSQIEGVGAAVAALRPNAEGSDALVAYVQGQVARDTLREAVNAALPRSITLAALIAIDAVPVSANGKIDRGALPDPKPEDWFGRVGGRKPQTQTETTLFQIWSDVLGRNDLGTDGDFYEIGGDSLSAVRISHAAQAVGLQLAVADIFRRRTIVEIAKHLETQSPTGPETKPPRRSFARLSDTARAQLADALRQQDD